MKITTSISIEEDLLKSLDIRAEEENRTRSNYIEQILKDLFIEKIEPKD